jgi:hypothetical protein
MMGSVMVCASVGSMEQMMGYWSDLGSGRVLAGVSVQLSGKEMVFVRETGMGSQWGEL